MADLDIQTSKRPAGFTPPTRAGEKAAPMESDKVRILIPKTKDQTRDVFVSVNGNPYLVKRGEPVEVPRAVAHALEWARQIEYEEIINPVTGRKELVTQETMSYPFQYV